jgi:hypothetical protein
MRRIDDGRPLKSSQSYIDVLDRAELPPQVLHHFHLIDRRAERIGGRAHGIHDGLPRRIGGNPCQLSSGARCLGCNPRLLAGDARRLGGVPELLSFLSDRFEHLMIANLTSLFRQSPELLRLISGCLRGDAVLFRKPADLGIVMNVVHHITSTSAY